MSMRGSRRSFVAGLTATLSIAGCGSRGSERGTIVGRIPDPTLPWNAPEIEAANSDLAPPMRTPGWDRNGLALSMDGRLLATALDRAPTNEILVVDTATRRGWCLRHRHRRVLVTAPVFLPDGRLSLIVTPPPNYMRLSEIWIVDARSGASSACISGRPAYLYRRPHFSADCTKCVVFREADDGLYPWPEGRPRREYREPNPVSLFEIDLSTRSEQRLSAHAFELGRAFYAQDRDGYYLSTSDPLITTPPLWPGGPSGYEAPDFLTGLSEESYPFNGFFCQGERKLLSGQRA
jgi:hypothetical protein